MLLAARMIVAGQFAARTSTGSRLWLGEAVRGAEAEAETQQPKPTNGDGLCGAASLRDLTSFESWTAGTEESSREWRRSKRTGDADRAIGERPEDRGQRTDRKAARSSASERSLLPRPHFSRLLCLGLPPQASPALSVWQGYHAFHIRSSCPHLCSTHAAHVSQARCLLADP